MSEAKLRQTATAKFIAQNPLCALCGGIRKSETREHLPAKSIFFNRARPDGLIVPSCRECNNGTSDADLVSAIVSRWSFSEQTNTADHAYLVPRLRAGRPDILQEWTRLSDARRLKAVREFRQLGATIESDWGVVSIGPKTKTQLNIFVHKLVCGVFFCKIGRFISNEGAVSATFRTKEDFFNGGFPKDLLDLVPRFEALRQGKWDTADQFALRYDFNKEVGLVALIASLRSNLFFIGFGVSDFKVLDEANADYIAPSEILNQKDRFERRLW